MNKSYKTAPAAGTGHTIFSTKNKNGHAVISMSVFFPERTKGAPHLRSTPSGIEPATTYFPGQLPAKYHQRRRA